MKKRYLWIALILPFFSTATSQAQEDVAILLKRVPEWANALTVVRLKALLESPRGVREGWAAKYELGYLDGAVRIPPSVKTMVLATQFQVHDSVAATTVGVALLNKNRSLALRNLASREGGEIETVANHPVVLTSRNSYVVELEPGLMGGMHPANRQELARWIRFADRNQDPVLSPYLRNAVSAGRGAPIQMAIDLEDIVDPKAVHLWLPNCKVLKGNKAPCDALEELIKGLRGARFAVRVGETTTAEVRLDFSKPVGSHADYIKDLFLESLDEIGAALDDFRNSQVRTEAEGKTVVLKTDLSNDELRLIMSLIQIPSTDADPEAAPSAPPSPGAKGSGAKADPVATQRYYDAVQRLLNDLKRKTKKAEDYVKTAVWHETYARRINQLPRQGVDEEMLAYGLSVSSKLWALANSLRGVPLKVDLLQSQKYVYTPPTIYFGRRGPINFLSPLNYGVAAPTYTDTNIPEMTAKQQEAVAQGESDRENIWKTLDQEKYRIRRRMAEKYGPSFSPSK
jgi:hypothetical protein